MDAAGLSRTLAAQYLDNLVSHPSPLQGRRRPASDLDTARVHAVSDVTLPATGASDRQRGGASAATLDPSAAYRLRRALKVCSHGVALCGIAAQQRRHFGLRSSTSVSDTYTMGGRKLDTQIDSHMKCTAEIIREPITARRCYNRQEKRHNIQAYTCPSLVCQRIISRYNVQ